LVSSDGREPSSVRPKSFGDAFCGRWSTRRRAEFCRFDGRDGIGEAAQNFAPGTADCFRCHDFFSNRRSCLAWLFGRHCVCFFNQRRNFAVYDIIADLFGHRPALQSPERDEQASIGEDVAVFPLAIPLLSGPGTITTILLLANQARANTSRIWILALVSAAVYLISWCLLYASERLIARLGEGKVRILTRVLGIVLAAVAVQYVLNGVGGYYQSLLNGQ